MPLFTALGRLAREFSRARNRFMTERSIRALSPELREDIGWPDSYRMRNVREVAPSLWSGDL